MLNRRKTKKGDFPSSFFFDKVEGGAVDAVAEAGRRRSVPEHVTKMRATPRAQHLGAPRVQTGVEFYEL